MKIFSCLFFSVLAFSSCNDTSSSAKAEKQSPQNIVASVDTVGISFEFVNRKDENGIGFYDVYIKDTTQIRRLNKYLVGYFKNLGNKSIMINYFSDRSAAKEYFSACE